MTEARVLTFKRPIKPPVEQIEELVILPRCRHCGHTNDVHLDGIGECWPGFYCVCMKFESERPE